MVYNYTGKSECNKLSLCVDCDSDTCIHAGSLMADCPKHYCDNIKIDDCENCDWMKEYIRIARDDIRKKQ